MFAEPDAKDLQGRVRALVQISPTGCWLWRGHINKDGYGDTMIGRKIVLAHRLAYTLFVGQIPGDLPLDHTCHSFDLKCVGGTCEHRACVNPAHLEPVSHRVNILRGRGLAAREAQQTHCHSGHAFDEANTYVYRGKRCCRACNAAAQGRCTARVARGNR